MSARSTKGLRGLGTRLAMAALLALGGAAGASACGLETVGTGKLLASDASVGPTTDAAVQAPDDASSTTQDDSCAAPRVTCGAECVDTKSDPKHCGRCGNGCPDGEACVDSACTIVCAAPTTKCGTACVDTKVDPNHCGKCDDPCSLGTVCSDGKCVTDCGATLKRCTPTGGSTDVCVDVTKDPKNCGDCNRACAPNEVCTGSACVAVCATGSTPGDFFGGKMVGCKGTVSFTDRAKLCPPGVPVCKASDWTAKAGGKAPSFNYWTNDALGYFGDNNDCRVGTDPRYYYSCNPSSSPMRVCANYTDPLGNKCNWIGCGLGQRTDQHFGGCNSNNTAGALCCPP